MKSYFSLLLTVLLGQQFSQISIVDGQFFFGFWFPLSQPFNAVLDVAQHSSIVIDMLGKLLVGVHNSF